jgi:hypothetical protein
MSLEKRPLFREHAMQQYMQRREKDILPRLVKPPTFLLCWLFFALLVGAGVITWEERIPVFVNGTGVVSAQTNQPASGDNEISTTVFLPASGSQQIRNGSPGIIQFGSTGQSFSGRVLRIEPGVLSSGEAQNRYQLSCSATHTFTEPMIAVDMSLKLPSSLHIAPGTAIQAQMQTGSKRILSLLPGLDGLTGE